MRLDRHLATARHFSTAISHTEFRPEAVTLAGVTTIDYSGLIANKFDFESLPLPTSTTPFSAINFNELRIHYRPLFEIIGNTVNGYRVALKTGASIDGSAQKSSDRNFTINVKAPIRRGELYASHPHPRTFQYCRSREYQGRRCERLHCRRERHGCYGLLSATDADGVSALNYQIVDASGASLTTTPFEIVAGMTGAAFN